MRLTGRSAFPITPTDRAGRVDVAAFRSLVTRLCAAKVDSIGGARQRRFLPLPHLSTLRPDADG